MDSLIIKGGIPLEGNISISGAKNAALPIMTTALLTDKLSINNIPKLTDILTMKKLLENLGSIVTVTDHQDHLSMDIDSSNINNFTAPYDIVRKMRASIWVLGPLLSRFSKAKVSLPGGCAIGARQVDLHIGVLQAMGANIDVDHGYINATIKGRLKAVHFVFKKISVGATINAIMAATLAEGETILFNCAREPEIVDLCHCLNKMGAEIDGIATSEITIIGKSSLKNTNYSIMPDRIEAGTYMMAAAITKGNLNIYGINNNIIENIVLKLIEAGIKVEPIDNGLRVSYVDRLNPVDVHTSPYPGFSTDFQAQFMSLMTLCNGSSTITETIFENRFMHVPELCRMGANITIKGNSARVHGVPFLTGAEVMASDLRASVSLVLAGLAANDTTKIHRIYHLDRGYQTLEKKLSNCGANIVRITGDTV
ncbi:UDP-N-acetylglucosamine 1-carboxyvinyltransferase [Pseudolycoriella hygida]|uniref:UDP-N-acetylglucosamine 1-carboxyvinyltransferase n=1 Tax=Pseudolycoriella hygida TaxID=35572 RepID=A0A9Q0N7E6_9DIPT|nr:UDP-N-acetylglucosamine 1-carboxyvinyltransferase [Pseudolycoriella hygida]